MQQLQEAVALHNKGELSQAEEIYRKVLSADENNFFALNFCGCILRSKGRLKDACLFLERAVSIRNGDVGAQYNLGNVLRDLGAFSSALTHYKSALAVDPSEPRVLYAFAKCCKELGDSVAAIATYEKAIEVKPDFMEAYLSLATVLKSEGKVDKAIAIYRKAIEVKPDFTNAKKALMQCQGQNGFRDQISVEDYREQMEGNDEAGILIAAYPSFEMIPSNRRSVNSWVEDKNKFYFAGQMFGRVFVDLPWVKASSYATSSRLQIPDVGDEYLDAVDFYLSKIKTLQIRMSQAPIISSLVEYVARKKGSSIDVIDIGGWSGNALFLAGFNDSWDVVKTWEVIETAAVCSPARDQLPGMLDSLPDDSAGKRNLVKLSFTELESFYGESSDSQNVDLIWSSTAQHYNAFFPRDLDALLSRGAQVVYFDTLPYLCSSNPSLNICELSELGVNDQNVYFLISQQYLSSLISEASQKHGYSYKLWSQSVEPRLVFWQPQEGDKVLPKKVIDGAKPLLMKVCSIRFDKLD